MRLAVLVALSLGGPSLANGQTLVQLSDMGSNIGPRLTRTVSQQRINRKLFGRIGTKVSFINNGTAYELASDPRWNRVLVGLKDNWISEYVNAGGPGGRIVKPYGIDISARRNVYIADRGGSRVLIATFDPAAKNLVSPRNLPLAGARPIDVAWDGQTAPLTNDYLYVLDDALGRVSYWNFNAGVPAAPVWQYGTTGSGTGQFKNPTGICVSKQGAGIGGTQFTTVFFVVDRGNKRVVRLYRNTTGGVVWDQVVTQAGWDPADCTVDHWGQLYVTDAAGHKVWKYNQYLWFLDTYGGYGTGPGALNTFASPNAVSAPCGLKAVTSGTVWYCEGRLITAERWSDATGALEHWLGVKSSVTASPTSAEGSASATIRVTDVAYISAVIYKSGGGNVRTLYTDVLYSAGSISAFWNGKDNAGAAVADGAYKFTFTIKSSYGCPTGAFFAWCYLNLSTPWFQYHYCVPGGGGGELAVVATAATPGTVEEPGPGVNALPGPPTCGAAATIAGDVTSLDGNPAKFAVRQLPGDLGILQRGLSRLSSAGLRPTLSLAGEPITSAPGLWMQVRESGITAVQVNLPETGTVRVKIVDLRGRVVLRQEYPATEPGALAYRWNGRDEADRVMPPGVYVITVEAAGHSESTKLIFTRPSP